MPIHFSNGDFILSIILKRVKLYSDWTWHYVAVGANLWAGKFAVDLNAKCEG